MADVQANIVLTTTGGDESAAQLQMAEEGIENITSASSGMQHQFQERFQHVGLMLFAGDALRASGLGMETREVIVSMNAALSAVAMSAGIGLGGILLLVTALIAFAGILEKIIQHHKDETEALEKQIAATQKQYDAVTQTIAQMEAYQDAGGKLTEVQQTLLAADKAVADDLKSNQVEALQKVIDAYVANGTEIQKHYALLTLWHTALADAKTALGLVVTGFENAFPVLTAVAQIFEKLIGDAATFYSRLLNLSSVLKVGTNEMKEMNQALDQNAAKAAEANAKLEALASGASSDFKQMTQALEQENARERGLMDEKIASFTAGQQKMTADEQNQAGFRLQAELNANAMFKANNKELYAAIAEDQKKLAAQSNQVSKQMAATFREGTKTIADDFGKAFADMLTKGESFTKAMTQAFDQLAQQIIEDILRMIAEWSVFTALTGMGGGAAAFGAKAFPQFAGGQAVGGSVMATSPTMALFGEAGPEMATFSPMSGGGSPGGGGGGGGNTINIQVTANGVNDPQELARMVGPALIQEIRGMGQLDFTRA